MSTSFLGVERIGAPSGKPWSGSSSTPIQGTQCPDALQKRLREGDDVDGQQPISANTRIPYKRPKLAGVPPPHFSSFYTGYPSIPAGASMRWKKTEEGDYVLEKGKRVLVFEDWGAEWDFRWSGGVVLNEPCCGCKAKGFWCIVPPKSHSRRCLVCVKRQKSASHQRSECEPTDWAQFSMTPIPDPDTCKVPKTLDANWACQAESQARQARREAARYRQAREEGEKRAYQALLESSQTTNIEPIKSESQDEPASGEESRSRCSDEQIAEQAGGLDEDNGPEEGSSEGRDSSDGEASDDEDRFNSESSVKAEAMSNTITVASPVTQMESDEENSSEDDRFSGSTETAQEAQFDTESSQDDACIEMETENDFSDEEEEPDEGDEGDDEEQPAPDAIPGHRIKVEAASWSFEGFGRRPSTSFR